MNNLLNEEKILELSRYIYNISLRMLYIKEEAEDATQEVLYKIIKNIDKFEQKSKLETWVYRITVNHLLDIKNYKFKELTYKEFSDDLNIDYSRYTYSGMSEIDEKMYVEEMKIGCTHAMLHCLDKESRIIFILSNIFDINSNIGGEILDIQAATYRKRLSRINTKVNLFIHDNCGLVNENAVCNCKRRLPVAIEKQRLVKDNLIFYKEKSVPISEFVNSVNDLDKISKIYKASPFYELNNELKEKLKKMINNGKYMILEMG